MIKTTEVIPVNEGKQWRVALTFSNGQVKYSVLFVTMLDAMRYASRIATTHKAEMKGLS